MAERLRKAILFLFIYLVALWIGFRTGEIYNRMHAKVQIEKIIIPETKATNFFYIVEERDYGTYKSTDFYQIADSNPIIKFLYNNKLKPLLSRRKLEIYDSRGDRMY